MRLEQGCSREEVVNYYPWVNGLLQQYVRFLPAAAGEICKLLPHWDQGNLPAVFIEPDKWPKLSEYGLTDGVLILGVEELLIAEILRERPGGGQPLISEELMAVNYNLRAGEFRDSAVYCLQLSPMMIDFNSASRLYPTTCLYYYQIMGALAGDLNWEAVMGKGIQSSMADQAIVLNSQCSLPIGEIRSATDTVELIATRARALIMGVGILGPATNDVKSAVERQLIPRALIEVLAVQPLLTV